MISAIQNISYRIPFLGAAATQPKMERMPWYLFQNANGDVFVKSKDEKPPEELTNEQWQALIPNDFVDWANKTDFIHNGLKEVFTPENFIGEGFEHAAYQIPSHPDYVVRFEKFYKEKMPEVDFSNYTISDKRDMFLNGNFGQIVALLEDDTSKGLDQGPRIQIMKKQEGFPNANCSPKCLFHENGTYRKGVVPYEADERKRHFAYSMKVLANFPDKAYDELVDDIMVAGEAGYRVDANNSNNFLIDEKNQRINLIDMDSAPKPFKNRYSDTLCALINYEFLGEYLRKDSGYVPEDPNELNDTIGNMITIADKYASAMKRKVQKFNPDTSLKLFNFLTDKYSVSSFWLKTFDYQEKLQKLREMGVLYEGDESAC